MGEAEGENGKNQCGCDKSTCRHTKKDGFCSDYTCKEYKSCCEPDCPGCKKNCNGVTNCEYCKCRRSQCGCPINCYKSNKNCQGKTNNCQRCTTRCEDGKPCLCYQCSCGTQCNGVICSCCSWCDPRNCSGKKCDGYVIGRCEGNGPCKGHVKYDNYDDGNYGAVLDRKTPNRIPCDKTPHQGKECTDNNCNWISADETKDGCCLKLCTYCGDLCGQDNFRRCCYIAVPLFITVSAFLIFRFMLPEKFHAITTKIRAVFPSTPRHPGRSLSNLVGDRLPEEMSVDRYPAFRPKAFAGLA